MTSRKLRNLLEFKDRDQVRNLLELASGRTDINDILLGYIKNAKWALHGFFEGPVLHGLIGLHLLEKKEAQIQYIAVRPEDQKTGIGGDLVAAVQEKYKLKKI